MVKFFRGRKERVSELEAVIGGIPFSGDITRAFYKKSKGGDEEIEAPFYVLPVENYHGIIYGAISFGGDVLEFPLGFSRNHLFMKKKHYHPAEDGVPVEVQYDSNTLYLPLKQTNLLASMSIVEADQDISGKRLFSVFGIEGKDGIHPILLVSETEEGLDYVGLSLINNKMGGFWSQNVTGELGSQLKEFLKQYNLGKSLSSAKPKEKAVATITEVKDDEKLNWDEPKEIVRYLDQYIIGQAEAKKVIAVAFSSYMVKVKLKDDRLPKSNIMLVGPSGVGKTYAISLLAKKARLPMAQTKLTGKCAVGYKGEQLISIFKDIRAKSPDEAPYGIIFLDEIDKMALYDSDHSFGQQLQDEMIGWLEDADIREIVQGGAANDSLMLNTKNLLFVTAGAFSGGGGNDTLEGILAKRLGQHRNKLGFCIDSIAKEDKGMMMQKLRPGDLVEYGFKPELIGRLPCIGVLNALTTEDKIRILTHAKNSALESYSALIEAKGFKVETELATLKVIAGKCPPETGARALTAICNDLFTELIYEPEKYADDKKIIRITPVMAEELITLYG